MKVAIFIGTLWFFSSFAHGESRFHVKEIPRDSKTFCTNNPGTAYCIKAHPELADFQVTEKVLCRPTANQRCEGKKCQPHPGFASLVVDKKNAKLCDRSKNCAEFTLSYQQASTDHWVAASEGEAGIRVHFNALTPPTTFSLVRQSLNWADSAVGTCRPQ